MLKILVAYDGSECSERALHDLRNAGLPEKAQAVVLSVADRWKDSAFFAGYSTYPFTLPVGDEFDRMQLSIQEAAKLAAAAADRLREYFPHWEIDSRSVAGSAADGIIAKIEEWKPDYVVLGSHGRSAGGRLLFGSVSHKILTQVHCNLRIARERVRKEGRVGPLRVLVAYDGSQESETAFETAVGRCWPKGTAVRLVTVVDMKVATAFLRPSGPMRFWTNAEDKNPVAWIDRMLSYQKKRIEEKGLIGYAETLEGDPKRVLLDEAEKWGADVIFAGCRGLTGKERIVAGSVSTALAMHAPCAVEVVHRLWTACGCCDESNEESRDTMMRTAKAGARK